MEISALGWPATPRRVLQAPRHQSPSVRGTGKSERASFQFLPSFFLLTVTRTFFGLVDRLYIVLYV